MKENKEAVDAFEKIISHGRTLAIRKAAEAYWSSYNSAEGADEKLGKNLEQAIKSIPIDYRSPTIKPLEDLNACKENNTVISTCYLTLAISLVDRITKII